MNEFEKLLTELREHIEELEETFIRQFIKKRETEPHEPIELDEYKHHVKAYCVLCYAAIEEYFEKIALKVMHQCLDEWVSLRKYTDTLVTLVSYCKQTLQIDSDENTKETTVFEYQKDIFDHVKQIFSIHVHNNHGISLKYLRGLLIPVGIDIKEDIRLKSSLNKLARERGKYAHQRAEHPLSPEDARNYVNDCLELYEDVKTKAEHKFI